ncbi:MAG: OadG family protein [Lachnospiraceae bacterium]|nr:OadG family protein [Lachnospiraceae bacterium]
MKNIKKIAACAGGIFGALLANPFVAMAATEATQKKSLGERMLTALLNTVMGIMIVFIVLLLIAWIISLFKYINKFEASQAAKKAAMTVVEEVPVPVETVEAAKEELSDDLELVAVVTAAIHAYEESQGNEVPADGLVVRSIRKVGKANWQNA